jgi:RES domain-containing protein
MRPYQFRWLRGFLNTSFGALSREVNEATKKQENAITEAAQAANEERNKIPEVIARIATAIEATNADVKSYEKPQRKKEYRLQKWSLLPAWITALATTGAFIGAFVYANIASRQLREMKQTNELNRKALELSRNMFHASQAAVFTCQMMVQFEASRVLVECRDVGQISATDVHGEAILTRGQREGAQKRTISRDLVLKGDVFSAFYPINVPAPGPTQFDWIARQHLKIETTFTYNDGFEVKSQSYCGTLLVDVKQRNYGPTDCEIAKELQEGQPR